MTIKRQTVTFSLLAGAVFAGGVFTHAARRHDPRFDDVDALLEKAAIEIAVAECPTTGKAQKDCERYAQRTLSHIESARADLADAVVAADSGGLR